MLSSRIESSSTLRKEKMKVGLRGGIKGRTREVLGRGGGGGGLHVPEIGSAQEGGEKGAGILREREGIVVSGWGRRVRTNPARTFPRLFSTTMDVEVLSAFSRCDELSWFFLS